jgi:hypothetical protein
LAVIFAPVQPTVSNGSEQMKMKRSKKIFTRLQQCSSIFMMMALLWLTVSSGIVFAAFQKIADSDHTIAFAFNPNTAEEEAPSPFGNNTEEKSPNTSFSEEYLHHKDHEHTYLSKRAEYHKPENADQYIAFHGELLVPPPNYS